MIFKLIKIVNRINPLEVITQEEHDSMLEGFFKVYNQYGVKVIGMWTKDDGRNNYTLTAYRDENHYFEFVEAMKNNPEYLRLSIEIRKWRESTSSETLHLDPRSPLIIDLVDYNAYIDEAKKILSEN